MARVKTLRERVESIIRKYKHVNPEKYLYNNKTELKRTYKRIKVWFLIHDEQRGYSIMNMEFKRVLPMNVAQWSDMYKKGYGSYNSLYNIFTQAVLPAINNKGGNQWRFISLLCWTGVNDLRRAKNPAASRRRHKTS